MAETKRPIKVVFISSNLATSDHFREEVNLIVNRMGDILRTITGIFGAHKGGVLHSDYFNISNDGANLKISPGVAVFPMAGSEYVFAVSDYTLTIDTNSALSDGSVLQADHTYDVYLHYRETTSSDIVTVNPVSGDIEDGLTLSIIDDSSALITPLFIPEGYSIYFRDIDEGAPIPSSGFVYLGRFYKSESGLEILKRATIVPIKIPFVDDDPDNRLSEIITPSVEPYTDLMNFLASKGHAPRTTTNPFGIAYEDVGGPRDYYLLFTKSAIVKDESSNYNTYKPDRDSGYPMYVKIHVPNDKDFIVLGGVKSDIPPVLEAPMEFPGIFISEASNPNPSADYSTWIYVKLPTKVYDNEVWLLAIEYDDADNKFYLRWVGGSPDTPLYNVPLLGSDDINDFLGKVASDDSHQLVITNEMREFITSDRFLPLLLIGRHSTLTEVKLGVFYDDEGGGVNFNPNGSPGDVRRYHFLPMEYVRWGGSYSLSNQNSVENGIRKSLGDFLRWHFTITDTDGTFRHYDTDIRSTIMYPGQPSTSLRDFSRVHVEQLPITNDFTRLITNSNSRGLSFLHHADRILRNTGYEYLTDAEDEKDVDSALNAIYREVKAPLATIEFRLGATQSESLSRWNDVAQTITQNYYDRSIVVLLIRPHSGNYVFTLPQETLIRNMGTLYIINLGVEMRPDSTYGSVIRNDLNGGIIISGGVWVDYISFRDYSYVIMKDLTAGSVGIATGIGVYTSRTLIHNVLDSSFTVHILGRAREIAVTNSHIGNISLDAGGTWLFPYEVLIDSSYIAYHIPQGINRTIISNSTMGDTGSFIINGVDKPDLLLIDSSYIRFTETINTKHLKVNNSTITITGNNLASLKYESSISNSVIYMNNADPSANPDIILADLWYEPSGPPWPVDGNSGWRTGTNATYRINFTGNTLIVEQSGVNLKGASHSSIKVIATGNIFKGVSSVDYSTIYPSDSTLFDQINIVEA